MADVKKDDKKEEGDVEVKKTSAEKLEDLTKTLQGFTDQVKTQQESAKDLSEKKAEMDKMKAEMSTLLETINKEKAEIAKRTIIEGDSKEDRGIGYESKDVFTRHEQKDMSFDELLTDSGECSVALKSIQSRASDIYILGTLIAGRHGVKFQDVVHRLKTYQDFMKDTEGLMKAMSIDSGSAGFEWIPTGFSSDLIEIFHLAMVVGNLHPKFTIPQKMTSWKVPGTSSDLKAFRTTAAASDTPNKFRSSTRSTRNVTFTPEKLVAATLFDVELEEDSIIPVLPNLKVNIAQALARGVEDTIINGDTAGTMDNTDMHGRTIDEESPTKMWDGWRQYITDNGNTRLNAGGGATFGGMITVQRNMGKYGINPRSLAWVTSPNGYFDAFLHVTKVQTIDLFGPAAIVQRGELARFNGIPIILSEQERQDLKTSTGVSGGASSGYTDTSVQLVWKPGFSFGSKRAMTVESAKIPRTDTVEVWATMRADFQANYLTSEEIVSEATNVA